MTINFEVIESVPTSLNLTKEEATLLAAMGRELSSKQTWWGNPQLNEKRSVIDVRPNNTDGFEVTFREVIGVVQLGSIKIRSVPKIPWDHFIYIASRSEFSARLSSEATTLGAGFEFLDLLCRWFIDATERLVRIGLRQEYAETTQELDVVRGHLLTNETATEILKGRAVATCTFDELSSDTPLNRILRAACQQISIIENISLDLRKKARNLVYRMDGIGQMRHTDRRLKPDRLTQNYIRPISLAHLILDGCGISLSDGNTHAKSFLLRTPEVIEDGLRTIISEGLPDMEVSKRRQMLGESGISMNPDIVFGNRLAIGDVKYKYFGRDWNRNDFNQIVAFATAFESPRCVLFGFVNETVSPRLEMVQVGRIEATRIAWPVGPGTSPEAVSHTMLEGLKKWLSQ